MPHDSSEETAKQIEIAYRPTADLKVDPRNPRVHTNKQIRQIARSIETFGFNVPILIDANLKVVAGHGRILAAQQIGMTTVPTILLDHLTGAQLRAFMIADNRLTENAEWNEQLLGEQLRELSVLDLDFDIEITGFDTGEIDVLIDGVEAAADEKRDAADELPAAGPSVSKPGDLWLLGDN